MNSKIAVGFWIKESGNIMMHSRGLTEAEVEFFKSLKVGDRLIGWRETRKDNPAKPDYRLRVVEPIKPVDEDI